jgi:DtxR family Mn-dependent transcriptional regulator
MTSNKAEEILETLWITLEEKKKSSVVAADIGLTAEDTSLPELISSKLVTVAPDLKIVLTENGRKYGRSIVRRHRLAERLLEDVLDVKGDILNKKACEFEHILHQGIDDKICALLGHPKLCPHGHEIPSGECCEKKSLHLKIVSPLSGLTPGQSGKIAYVHSKDDEKIQKIIAIGGFPGTKITLLQSFPSFLFKIGNSEFAVDESIAEDIFVRLDDEENKNGQSAVSRKNAYRVIFCTLWFG